MNQTLQIITMVIVLVGVLGVIIGLNPYLKLKGVNVSSILDNAQKVTESVDKVLGVVQDILPNNPTVGLLTIIEKWAKIGVGNAEQLYHSGEATSDERATIAEQTVYNVLSELNITVDDNKKILIDAAIKEAVNNLGHTKPAVVKTVDDTVKVMTVEPIIKYVAPNGIELQPVIQVTSETTNITGQPAYPTSETMDTTTQTAS